MESIVKFHKRAEAFDDPMIGGRLAAVLRRLEPRLPVTDRHVLVHASFKPSHLHDCQDAVGLIDWDGYRQGPVEYDMSTFLATMAFDATVHPERADAVDAARAAFVGACTDLVDPLVLQWFEALALTKVVSRLGQGDRAATEVATALLDQAHALLG